METLIKSLQAKIFETLNLMEGAPDTIAPDEPLIGGRLGLDSIDVLELVMMIEKDYGVKIDSKELGARVFANLRALAAFIHDHSPEMMKN